VTLPLIVRPPAEADIRRIQEEYAAISPRLCERFTARLREVFERIESIPEMYGLVWQDVRGVRLKKFPHVVYYVVFSNRSEVLAVLHGARDSSTWQERL
jgi:toxin ParE1/3/4